MRIAFASGKGGTGKTTLSVNFALYLSRSRDVLLTDFDVEEPDSHLFIQGEKVRQLKRYVEVPQVNESLCDLCGICRKVCNFHAITQLGKHLMIFPQLCHSCYACVEFCPQKALVMVPEELGALTETRQDRLRFVEARLNIGKEMAVPLIKQAAEFIEQQYPGQLVIIDAPPGTSCPVVQTIRYSDYVVLVTEPTPFGLHDLTLAVDTVRQLDRPFGVIINKDDGEENDVVRYCREEGVEILVKVPHQRSIAETYARGLSLYDKNPVFLEQMILLQEKLAEKGV